MQFEVGSIVEGKVTGITKFGAFVDIGDGKTGMVHISEVAPTYVKEITDHISDGEQVKVKILNIGDDGKISLSIKRAMPPAPSSGYNNSFQGRRQDTGQRPRRDFSQGGQTGGAGGSRRSSGADSSSMSFEDMLSKFKQTSEDKMSDLKKSSEVKRPRRGAYK